MAKESEEMTQQNMFNEHLTRREIWKKKPQIRLVYERWVKKMKPYLPSEGPLLEIGSGSGLLREFMPAVIMTDIVDLPWIDRVVDGMHMPFGNASVAGVIGMDVLHHIGEPHLSLEEIVRVLKPGGRAIFIEPYITPFSFMGYKILHHESINFRDYHPLGVEKDPWDGNIALANLVFKRDLRKWEILHPDFKIIHKELFSFFDYTCAAGFKPYAFVPHRAFRHLIKVDNFLKVLMPLIAFRIFVVLEKR